MESLPASAAMPISFNENCYVLGKIPNSLKLFSFIFVIETTKVLGEAHCLIL